MKSIRLTSWWWEKGIGSSPPPEVLHSLRGFTCSRVLFSLATVVESSGTRIFWDVGGSGAHQ